jgi:hypothetical protein
MAMLRRRVFCGIKKIQKGFENEGSFFTIVLEKKEIKNTLLYA